MNLVDSSGWLEYFADGPNASIFEPPILDLKNLIVPTLSLFEVFKRIIQQKDEGAALQAIAVMQQGNVIDLSTALAIDAARLSVELKIPMADSIILATSMSFEAVLWTQDSDFTGIENVKLIMKKG
jgi:predicted nucleic acid-binding protein